MEKCCICGKEFDNIIGLGTHIGMVHKNIMSKEEYYKLFINNESDGKCKKCGNNVRFISIGKGYTNFCEKCNYIMSREEKFILKYGENQGKTKFEKLKKKLRKSNSIDYYIKKYGEEEGREKWEDRKEKCKINEKNFIKKYGKEEGRKKWINLNKRKSFLNSKEGLIKNHGEEKAREICKSFGITKEQYIKKYGEKKWKKLSYKRGLSLRRDYYLEEANCNYDLADWLLFKRQSTFNIEKCIKKYGEEEGHKVSTTPPKPDGYGWSLRAPRLTRHSHR